ncbi:type II secretion system F family protein [Nanoarchaeota archaeon]
MVKVGKEFFKTTEKHKPKYTLFGRLKNMMTRRGELAHLRKAHLKKRLEKAGIRISTSKASKILFVLCVIINIFITIYSINLFYDGLKYNYTFIVLMLLVIWVFIFTIVSFITWFLFYVSLDVLIFNRRQRLEDVLPDFLQLVSSNVRAGMTVDRALWFAIRPRFGVLAKEIEEVAKRTFVGEPLEDALKHFVGKFDSKTLERSINLLVEGLRAGGEMGDLLNKISSNIQETHLMKKEMAANVTTYVIFITFATVVAAPFLFGLAFQLIVVIQEVFSRVDINPGAVSGFPIQVTSGVIDTGDFKIFAIVSLLVTSFFSAIIISAIKKGNIKGGIKYIPMFMFSSVVLFLIVVKLFSLFVGGFF